MKLKAEIGGEARDIEITETDGGLHAVVDGRDYEIEASEPEAGIYLLNTRVRSMRHRSPLPRLPAEPIPFGFAAARPQSVSLTRNGFAGPAPRMTTATALQR